MGPIDEPRRVYRRVHWGRHAELFILDCRSYRSVHKPTAAAAADGGGGSGTPQLSHMLGDAQLAWLKAGLVESTATWKFICTSVPLSYPTGWPRPQETGYDGWADGSSSSESVGPEAELLSILQHIRDSSVANVCFISGDVHFPFCISYDPFDDDRPLVHEIGATPLHALCLPRPPSGLGDTSLKPTVLYAGDVPFGGQLNNFGACTLDELGNATFALHEAATGRVLYELPLTPIRP